MQDFLFFAILFIMTGVAAILLFGLVNMARGGSPQSSQNFMRARVFLQLAAVVLIVGLFFLIGR